MENETLADLVKSFLNFNIDFNKNNRLIPLNSRYEVTNFLNKRDIIDDGEKGTLLFTNEQQE